MATDEVLRLIWEEKNTQAVTDAQARVAGMEKLLDSLKGAFHRAAIGEEEFREAATKLTGDLANAKAELQAFQRLAAGTKIDGRGMLQLGYLADDLQQFQHGLARGFQAINNNLPGLVMSMGGGPGLAGAIALVGTAVSLAAPKIEEFARSLLPDKVKSFTTEIGYLNEHIKELEKKDIKLSVDVLQIEYAKKQLADLEAQQRAFDELKKKKTPDQEARAKTVEAAAVRAPGGAEALLDRATDQLARENYAADREAKATAAELERIRKEKAEFQANGGASPILGPDVGKGLDAAWAEGQRKLAERQAAALIEAQKEMARLQAEAGKSPQGARAFADVLRRSGADAATLEILTGADSDKPPPVPPDEEHAKEERKKAGQKVIHDRKADFDRGAAEVRKDLAKHAQRAVKALQDEAAKDARQAAGAGDDGTAGDADDGFRAVGLGGGGGATATVGGMLRGIYKDMVKSAKLADKQFKDVGKDLDRELGKSMGEELEHAIVEGRSPAEAIRGLRKRIEDFVHKSAPALDAFPESFKLAVDQFSKKLRDQLDKTLANLKAVEGLTDDQARRRLALEAGERERKRAEKLIDDDMTPAQAARRNAVAVAGHADQHAEGLAADELGDFAANARQVYRRFDPRAPRMTAAQRAEAGKEMQGNLANMGIAPEDQLGIAKVFTDPKKVRQAPTILRDLMNAGADPKTALEQLPRVFENAGQNHLTLAASTHNIVNQLIRANMQQANLIARMRQEQAQQAQAIGQLSGFLGNVGRTNLNRP